MQYITSPNKFEWASEQVGKFTAGLNWASSQPGLSLPYRTKTKFT